VNTRVCLLTPGSLTSTRPSPNWKRARAKPREWPHCRGPLQRPENPLPLRFNFLVLGGKLNRRSQFDSNYEMCINALEISQLNSLSLVNLDPLAIPRVFSRSRSGVDCASPQTMPLSPIAMPRHSSIARLIQLSHSRVGQRWDFVYSFYLPSQLIAEFLKQTYWASGKVGYEGQFTPCMTMSSSAISP